MKKYTLVELGELENGSELVKFFQTEYELEIPIITPKEFLHEIGVCQQVINDLIFDGEEVNKNEIEINRNWITRFRKAIDQCRDQNITALYVGQIPEMRE